jgi:hypothetical protein
MEPESIVFPLKYLQFISLPITEHKETKREGIEIKTCLYKHSQTVNGLSQVGMTASQIHPIYGNLA